VAQRYLEIMGARRLIALDYRATGKGAWSERYSGPSSYNIAPPSLPPDTVEVPSKSKLENDLFISRLIVSGRADQSFLEKATTRIHTLTNLLPEKFDNFSDEELREYAEKMITYL